jgi:ABC-type antimicrobial peptide transport system permease subunit
MEVARIVEAEVRSLREREFVQAARMVGLSGRHIMFREILPNVTGPIIVAASLTVARRYFWKRILASSVMGSSRRCPAGETCSTAPSSIWPALPGLPSFLALRLRSR